jgi:very-short-patch-repair endonuclease
MGPTSDETSTGKGVWGIARDQHGVISRRQLLDEGFSSQAIKHRLAIGRLHPARRGVYAVGRPELTRKGRWMAVILACPPGSVLSDESAAALLGLEDRERAITVSMPPGSRCRIKDARLHCRKFVPGDRGVLDGIPVTSPARTLIDLATTAGERRLEAAVNAADKLDLIDPEALRAELDQRAGVPGAPALRALLDRDTLRLTDSELERRFLRLVRSAGLPLPQTGARLGPFTVDFHWPDLGLVVETDGLRYHRTPSQQASDRRRDQVLTAQGMVVLRFTHAQVVDEPERVIAALRDVARRLGRLFAA